jgi:hypothetical protein
MKKIMLLVAIFATSFMTYSQIQTPAPSPFAKLEQKVGVTDFTLEYSRPSMKGRTIFGDLVPFNKMWRTGANANTKITFSTDVIIEGKLLKAGSYAIYTIPYDGKWEVIFYADASNWGLPEKWDEEKAVAKTVPVSYPLPMDIETYTMSFDNLNNDSVVLGMMWEKTYVGVKIDVPTHKIVMMKIEEAMKGKPSGDEMYAAAVYYSQNGEDINRAKEWIDEAIKMSETPQFWKLRQQSLIYAKSGDTKGAIAIARKSLAAAQEAGNDDYVKMNMDSLKEWGAK